MTQSPSTRYPRRSLLLLGCYSAMLLLLACQPQGPEAQYSDYLVRLERTLSIEVPEVALPPLPWLPRPGQLRRDIPPSSLDILDFLALRGCALQVAIGKRNSSLGRLAKDSQRLLLELEYLQLAPACIADLREQERNTLADELQYAWLEKRQQLPALIFNATLGGAEYRALWQLPSSPGNYPDGTSSQVITALEAINGHIERWLAGDYQAHNRDFEILLGEVATGDGGALLQALALQEGWLSAADRMLEEKMLRGPLCSAGIRPAAADILPNVVRKVFIGQIQPRSAALGKRQYELLPAIAALERLLVAGVAPDYLAWQHARDSQLTELAAAPRRHVEQLKRILQPCMNVNSTDRPLEARIDAGQGN